MEFFREIYHKENLKLKGKVITREAVRGVILKNNKSIIKSSFFEEPRWTGRDSFVLEQIKKDKLNWIRILVKYF